VSEMFDAALGYADRGWPVFPLHSVDDHGRCACGDADCQSPGRHPLTDHGFEDATTDEQVIRDWWARWPWATSDSAPACTAITPW
jgi:putative DNA primase/helicase